MTLFKRTFWLIAVIFVLSIAILLPLIHFAGKLSSLNRSGLPIKKQKKVAFLKQTSSKIALLSANSESRKVTSEFLELQRSNFPANGQKVILIGLDGATFDVLLPLISAQQVPFFSLLLKTGVYGTLQSIRPIKSPAIWTSIATAKNRDKHGIEDFVTKDMNDHGMIPVTRFQRKVKAIWNMLDTMGRQSLIINWWATSPPEAINGIMVSDVFEFAYDPGQKNGKFKEVFQPPQTEYLLKDIDEGLDAEVEKWFKKITNGITFKEKRDSVPQQSQLDYASDDNLPFVMLKEFIRSDLLVFRASQQLLKEHSYELSAVYFQGIDVTSHYFWNQGHSESFKGMSVNPGGPVVASYYKFTDTLIGELSKLVDPKTNLVIVSDHGFQAAPGDKTRNFMINKLFEIAGLLVFKNDENDIDFDKTVVYDRDSHNTWENTRLCFLTGLDKTGTRKLTTVEDFAVTIESLWKMFSELTTLDGQKVFYSITKVIPDSVQRSANRPDMVFRFNPSLPPGEEVIIGQKKIRVGDFIKEEKYLPGYHELRGIFLGSGPCFLAGKKISGATVLDISPTLLHILGLPVAEDFDGKIIDSAFNTNIVTWTSTEIPSYETQDAGAPVKTGNVPFQKNVIDQLKGIGYLE
ncbi:MAG: hypothetical protein A2161_20400 [Candidatus Schekmanbacteria bacterium RBG_13_48_7]|uniref:Nucleotide pyrophosphatase n=1 Tax=Candidatus Schekmanbacteria bacterium RBG_13_48_7 TaxID=1817878 RepID=A0A1F7RP06_9BACT|nr:MAG: hypothetical protein A2161_20400 [Candidatus Schekmanbacteria bacterium RBG_13_48_7]